MTIKTSTMWRAAWLYAVLWATAMFVWVQAAFAQDVVDAGPVPLTPGVAADLVQAAHTHKWGLVLAIVVGALSKLLIWAGRKFNKDSAVGARVHKVLALPGASFIIPMLGSVSAMLVTSLSSGAPIDVNGIADAVLIGLAAGGWGPAAKAAQVDQAQDAGAAAAGEVKTKADAISAIRGPGAKP